ncbi:MAG: HAD-IIIA family hydrolase [Phascolarctobacterium sp.]|uniref:KdsC family phosphatase n=1 Tax=Phascolarctobacterium sp. TaxID=2049039 RepID=UPI0026DC6A63|nr:HAD-IIIA family hydrolase [Phascolarctobacterium sp.]MDO4921744.1 HAD-IIIA family hydrolase [Phascolarctobacterium sp.]
MAKNKKTQEELETLEYIRHVKDLFPRLERIRLLALDVDGVLTDGTINIGDDGEAFKSFNAKDGLGISCALRSGLQIALITGRKSPIVHRRAEELGITLMCEGVRDKYTALTMLYRSLGLQQEEVAYMGDDLNDLPAFKAAGLAFAPDDGVGEVCGAADHITFYPGGKGAVREIIELILRAQGKWNSLVDSYRQDGQGDQQ